MNSPFYCVAGKKKAQKMSLSDFLADDCKYRLQAASRFITTDPLQCIAGSWADEMATLPSARKSMCHSRIEPLTHLFSRL